MPEISQRFETYGHEMTAMEEHFKTI